MIATTKSSSIRVKPLFVLLTLDGTLILDGRAFKVINSVNYNKTFDFMTSFFGISGFGDAHPKVGLFDPQLPN